MSPLPRAQLLKGTTELLVLSVLEGERLHGYEIAQRIRDGVSAGVSFRPEDVIVLPGTA